MRGINCGRVVKATGDELSPCSDQLWPQPVRAGQGLALRGQLTIIAGSRQQIIIVRRAKSSMLKSEAAQLASVRIFLTGYAWWSRPMPRLETQWNDRDARNVRKSLSKD